MYVDFRRDERGLTAAQLAVICNQEQALSLLLDHRAQPNLRLGHLTQQAGTHLSQYVLCTVVSVKRLAVKLLFALTGWRQ